MIWVLTAFPGKLSAIGIQIIQAFIQFFDEFLLHKEIKKSFLNEVWFHKKLQFRVCALVIDSPEQANSNNTLVIGVCECDQIPADLEVVCDNEWVLLVIIYYTPVR